MYPTELLWQAACRPAVHGLLDAAQYAALKRKPASYPPSGPCYLCGREIPGAAQPTSARFDDATWTALVRFAVNPENWIYFKPEHVKDPYLKRLIQMRRARWPDEWWRIGQVAAYYGVSVVAVNKCIHDGRLPATRWGNWWIKRSDATTLKILPGAGSTQTAI